MSFRKELSVIPRNAWIVAWVAYLGFTTPMFFYVLPHDPQMGQWPRWGQALFVYGIFLFVFAFVALIGYVYGDAKRRGMRYILWTLLAIFVPDAIGIILYFILRDPLPISCPGCQNAVLSIYTFCPNCGTALRPYCSQCGKSVERGWINCGYCGTPLPKSR